jgi:hypothetical protein
MKRFLGLGLLCIFGPILLSVHAMVLSVKLEGTPTLGQSLRVEISATGDVGVENGLRGVSEVSKGTGTRSFSLGTLSALGIYTFRFFDDVNSRVFVLPVPGDATVAPRAPARTKEEDNAIQKFLGLHQRDLLLKGWKAWPLREEFAKKIVALSGVGTLALICPFEGLSCGPAGLGGLDVGLDLTIAFDEFFAEYCAKQGKLTEADLKLIKNAFITVKTTKSVLSVKGKWDAAVAAVEFFVAVVDNKNVEFSFGLLKDQKEKTESLILVIKKLK